MRRNVPAYSHESLDCVVVLHLITLLARWHSVSKFESRYGVVDAIYAIEAVRVEPRLSPTEEARARHHPLCFPILQKPRHLPRPALVVSSICESGLVCMQAAAATAYFA